MIPLLVSIWYKGSDNPPLSQDYASFWDTVPALTQLCTHVYICYSQCSSCQSQQLLDIDPMSVQCWPNVYDVGPTSLRHWMDISCLSTGMWPVPDEGRFQAHFNLSIVISVRIPPPPPAQLGWLRIHGGISAQIDNLVSFYDSSTRRSNRRPCFLLCLLHSPMSRVYLVSQHVSLCRTAAYQTINPPTVKRSNVQYCIPFAFTFSFAFSIQYFLLLFNLIGNSRGCYLANDNLGLYYDDFLFFFYFAFSTQACLLLFNLIGNSRGCYLANDNLGLFYYDFLFFFYFAFSTQACLLLFNLIGNSRVLLSYW